MNTVVVVELDEAAAELGTATEPGDEAAELESVALVLEAAAEVWLVCADVVGAELGVEVVDVEAAAEVKVADSLVVEVVEVEVVDVDDVLLVVVVDVDVLLVLELVEVVEVEDEELDVDETGVTL